MSTNVDDNGSDFILESAVRKFIRKTDIDEKQLAKLIDTVSEYAFITNDGSIIFTEKGRKLPLKKKIVLYAIVKYLAWRIKQIKKYTNEINIEDQYVTVRELSTYFKVKSNIIGARISELKQYLKPKDQTKREGLYYVIDPLEALNYIVRGREKIRSTTR